MKYMLTETRLRNYIAECVRDILRESRGIKSKRLYDIITRHGGFESPYGVQRIFDVHNLSDDDVVGEVSADLARRIGTTYRGSGQDYLTTGLNAWATERGARLERGDNCEYIPLKDGYKAVVIVRNEYQVRGREGEGWDAYHKKRTEREENRRLDGTRRYIPKYRDPLRDKLWKNPYKSGWSREDRENIMNAIKAGRKNLNPRY